MVSENKLQELNAQIKVKLAEGKLEEAERLSIELVESAERLKTQGENAGENFSAAVSKFVTSVITKVPSAFPPNPAQIAEIKESAINDEHLRLLALFHYVNAGLTALFSCMFLIYIGFGCFAVLHPLSGAATNGPPPEFGWILIAGGLTAMISMNIYAALNIWVAQCLKHRRNHLACLVVSGINCVNVPFGALLGVSTIMVLGREKVKGSFAKN